MTGTAAITINTNIASLTVQKYLSDATRGMNTAMERLSTGFRINSARDDAAGYSVAAAMQAKINGYDIIEMNSQMGLDMLTTQEGVLDIINGHLQRIRDLTMQAANGTYGSASLNALKEEVVQRMDEIDRLCDITDFNGTYLLDGSRQTDINLQVGLYSDHRCVVTMKKFLFESAKCGTIMGLNRAADAAHTTADGNLDLTYFPVTDGVQADINAATTAGYTYPARKTDANGNYVDTNGDPCKKEEAPIVAYYQSELSAQLKEKGIITAPDEGTSGGAVATNGEFVTTPDSVLDSNGFVKTENMCNAIYDNDGSARDFIDMIDLAIDNISLRCTTIGAYMNRLDSAINSTDVQRANLTEAKSTIKDADVAEVSSDYIKYQILQQSAASLLATANQMPSIALNLL